MDVLVEVSHSCGKGKFGKLAPKGNCLGCDSIYDVRERRAAKRPPPSLSPSILSVPKAEVAAPVLKPQKKPAAAPTCAPEDLCDFCKKREYKLCGHGIRNGEVYDEKFCVPCYAKRNQQLGRGALRRLGDHDDEDLD